MQKNMEYQLIRLNSHLPTLKFVKFHPKIPTSKIVQSTLVEECVLVLIQLKG